MTREDIIRMAQEAGIADAFLAEPHPGVMTQLERLVALVRADERERFYGQDKPAECAKGCPPNMVCDYCQVVAPVRAMILAEREACARIAWNFEPDENGPIETAIRARGRS